MAILLAQVSAAFFRKELRGRRIYNIAVSTIAKGESALEIEREKRFPLPVPTWISSCANERYYVTRLLPIYITVVV